MRSHLSRYDNFTQRIIVAILGAFLLIFCITNGPLTYFIIFFLICLLAMLEFYKLSGLDGMIPLKTWGSITGMTLFTTTYLVEMQLINYKVYYLFFPLLFFIFFIKLFKKTDKKPFTNIAYTILGVIYVSVPFSLLNFTICNQGSYNYNIILGLIFLIWSSDTGGYLVGSRFGKTKLFMRISPKKTWEGFFGGLIFSIITALLISYLTNQTDYLTWIIIAIIVVITSTFGDLVESLFKRSIDIKDSGNLLPGHGGMLDRFDGLLLSVPFIVPYMKLMEYFSN